MAAREEMGSQVDPGVIARIVQGVKYAIGLAPAGGFFGPMQPLPPVAQDAVEGRAFDYNVGQNLRYVPRNTEGVGFPMLRGFADNYDLLRLVIEKRKDQIEAFDWEIAPKDDKVKPETMQGDIDRVKAFMDSPDQEHTFLQWRRMLLEDLFVVDTMAIYPRMTKGGDLYGFEIVSPDTLNRLIDDSGRTPMPPEPAFQQVIKGVPAADYSRDTLIYSMRNPRSNRLYGFSPVEQVIMTVNIAMRRQMSQLEFYTAGNIPEALAQAPETWTPKQLQDFQGWWDSIMEGNTAQRRKMRFIPSLKDIVFPKLETLKDEMDDWLARVICFAFSIPPTALQKMVNRASGQQMSDTAKEEGLMPLLRFLEDFFTRIIQKYLKAPDLCFKFKLVDRLDPLAQAQVDQIYVTIKALTPDEVRARSLQLEPMAEDEKEKAWPTPVMGGVGPDGEPLPTKDGPPGAKPAPGGVAGGAGKPPGKGSPPDGGAEKVALALIEKFSPEALAKLADRLRPNVVELRPEVNVDVGDTTVHVPIRRGK